MEKYLALAGLMLASAIAVPKILDSRLEEDPQAQRPAVQQQQTARAETPKNKGSFNPLDGRKARIAMDSRGHFLTQAKMNGRSEEVLVDTGATYVAINQSLARRLGIRLKDSDFKYKVRTANGITYAAAAVIDEIRIGRVRVQNVQASVSRDESLNTVLLGMSFLKKLKKFEISGDELILIQ
ncbi:retropepsin-like aspartic protease family protein [Salaquimonas pukyongi]|uniref:retropepsin-like aspartic protease family protein n=1 Tax=Salaquimonas pukyongi TaxID=2712698 RepID=UPI00096B7EC7|nr:TIGR02281 family clan AA aspartic protease [Salaquimonas pukyongi]